jgi:type II secretion system (T2SS) protein M
VTPRDRRALIIGGGVVLAAVVLLRVLPATLRNVSDARALLRERAALLARSRDETGSLLKLRDSATVLSQALVALAPYLLSGSIEAEAAADIAGRVNIIASRAPAKVERLDPIRDSSSVGRLARVRLHAALETDVRGLVAVLKAIDSGDEVLLLEELHVEAPQAGSVERGPEILKVEVTVSGWYIRPRDAGNGKRET